MRIERGMICYDLNGDKWMIANVFMEGEEVVTYRHWNKHRKRWVFYTDFKTLFMYKFIYGGWKWKLRRDQKQVEKLIKK